MKETITMTTALKNNTKGLSELKQLEPDKAKNKRRQQDKKKKRRHFKKRLKKTFNIQIFIKVISHTETEFQGFSAKFRV